MDLAFKICFLFALGSTAGWVLELFYRRLIHHKWVNPGFLVGPYLPLYGFALVFLYLVCTIQLPIDNYVLKSIITILMLTFISTALEYVTGIIFIKKMKVKLWDYSTNWGNVQGIICPLFTLYWCILGAIYYFVLHPIMVKIANWFIGIPSLYFVIGMFFGLILVDTIYSVDLINKIRIWAKQKNIVVRYELLKDSIKDHKQQLSEKFSFFNAFKVKKDLSSILENYRQTMPAPVLKIKKHFKNKHIKNDAMSCQEKQNTINIEIKNDLSKINSQQNVNNNSSVNDVDKK